MTSGLFWSGVAIAGGDSAASVFFALNGQPAHAFLHLALAFGIAVTLAVVR